MVGRVRDTDTELAVNRPEYNRDRRRGWRHRPKSGLHKKQFIEDESAEEQGGQPAQQDRLAYAFPRHHQYPPGSSQVLVAGFPIA